MVLLWDDGRMPADVPGRWDFIVAFAVVTFMLIVAATELVSGLYPLFERRRRSSAGRFGEMR